MQVKTTSMLKKGYRRTIQRNGLALMGILFALYATSGLIGVGITQWVASQQFVPGDIQTTPILLVPPIVAGILGLVVGVATLVVSIAAIRVFVSDETERLPREYFTRNMLWVAVNFIVGAIVFAIIVTLGFVALIVPGIFLLVTLAFWSVYVAVEEENFIAAFRSSWGLTRGHRLNLLLLGVAVLVITILVEAVFDLGHLGGGSLELVVILLSQVGGAITTVFSTAVLAAAYTELTRAEEESLPPLSEDERTAPSDEIAGGA
ncbi:MAG TPA: hypothetical protein VFJ06_05285 [Halococcus sp.]|nr:hypothetical protein [Halococcus sp.]